MSDDSDDSSMFHFPSSPNENDLPRLSTPLGILFQSSPIESASSRPSPPKKQKITPTRSRGTRRTTSPSSHNSRPDSTVATANTQHNSIFGNPSSVGPPVASDPVIILVGQAKEKLFVHKHLLTSSSAYFDKLLTSEPIQENGQTTDSVPSFQTVNLLDVDQNAFRIYAQWLYTGNLYLSNVGETRAPDESSSKSRWEELSTCFILSAFLEASDFSDATIDAFIHRMKTVDESPIELAKWIYPRTIRASNHRSLCRDIVVHTWDRKKFDVLWNQGFPHEFIENVLADVSLRLDRGLQRRTITQFFDSKSTCMYHEHQRLNKPCYKSSFAVSVSIEF